MVKYILKYMRLEGRLSLTWNEDKSGLPHESSVKCCPEKDSIHYR